MRTIRVAIIRTRFRVTKCGFDWALKRRKHLCSKPGMALEILSIILENLGLKPEFVVPEAGFFGGSNGTQWDGMIGLLQRNQADISIPVLTDTPERRQGSHTNDVTNYVLIPVCQKPNATIL